MRHLDNKHIQEIGDSIFDFFGRSRDPEDIARRLRLGKSDHYDTTDGSKEFSTRELREHRQAVDNRENFTIYEKDKLDNLKKDLDALDEKDNKG